MRKQNKHFQRSESFLHISDFKFRNKCTKFVVYGTENYKQVERVIYTGNDQTSNIQGGLIFNDRT